MKEQDWENRIRDLMLDDYEIGGNLPLQDDIKDIDGIVLSYENVDNNHKKLVEYIKNLLSSQKQQILDMIEGMNIPTDFRNGDYLEGYTNGCNKALLDIKSKIEAL